MKKIAVLLLMALGLSACAATLGADNHSKLDWDAMATAKVAKVANIKSLIQPGIN